MTIVGTGTIRRTPSQPAIGRVEDGKETGSWLSNRRQATFARIPVHVTVYKLGAALAVDNANTVLPGLGLATPEADNGVTALQAADVDGVKLAGLLIDAGTTSSPVPVRLGPPGSAVPWSARQIQSSSRTACCRCRSAASARSRMS
jgi:hypothetical protein